MTHSAQISQKQDGHNIITIMKTMCPFGYHHNGFAANHALGHMMDGLYGTVHHVPKCISCHKARVHCFHDCIYIYIYTYSKVNIRNEFHIFRPFLDKVLSKKLYICDK